MSVAHDEKQLNRVLEIIESNEWFISIDFPDTTKVIVKRVNANTKWEIAWRFCDDYGCKKCLTVLSKAVKRLNRELDANSEQKPKVVIL